MIEQFIEFPSPKIWLVTGVAGFIGSNLMEALLQGGQKVIGIDNFETGHKRNLDNVLNVVTKTQRENFTFIEGDITNIDHVKRCFTGQGIDFVLHQAALGSVPRSINNPTKTNLVNVVGFLNVLKSAVDANVPKFIYASSSSVYGDSPHLPKKEDVIGAPLSPYAVSKRTNELYAAAFSKCYDIETIGLRYFNVFGPRQDPNGPYAAVIPLWVTSTLEGKPVYINGDGKTSRDFCYIENVVQANIKAALSERNPRSRAYYNVACGDQTTLADLFHLIQSTTGKTEKSPIFRDFRPGDVQHSLADITHIQKDIGYEPRVKLQKGMKRYIADIQSRQRNE